MSDTLSSMRKRPDPYLAIVTELGNLQGFGRPDNGEYLLTMYCRNLYHVHECLDAYCIPPSAIVSIRRLPAKLIHLIVNDHLLSHDTDRFAEDIRERLELDGR